MKKVLCLILSLLLCLVTVLPAFAAEKEDFTITNPYENVDWDSWGAYKTQLHCHTIASDGFQPIKEAIADYYSLDYDIVAITDHGNVQAFPEMAKAIRELNEKRQQQKYSTR